MRNLVLATLALSTLLTHACTHPPSRNHHAGTQIPKPRRSSPRKISIEQLKNQINQLITQLADEECRIREGAHAELSKLLCSGHSDIVLKYLRLAEESAKEPEVRHRLGCLVAPYDEVQRLKHGDQNARRSALEKLVIIGEPAVHPLLDILKKDKEKYIVATAVNLLGKIGGDKAIEALIKAFEYHPYVGVVIRDNSMTWEDCSIYESLAETLVEIGESAVAPLIKALKDKDSNVRSGAAEALGEIGDKRAIKPLIEGLKDSEKEVRWHSAAALGVIGDKAAVQPLIQALKDEERFVRLCAAEALGRIRDSRAAESLINLLKDEAYDVRTAAAYALGVIGDKRAVGPLIRALKDREEDVRAGAAFALGEIRDRKAVDPLIGALSDSCELVRAPAAIALAKIGDKRGIKRALKDADVRDWALEALIEIGKRAVEPLIAILKDKDGELRELAAQALGMIEDKGAIKPLIEALRDTREEVREYAAMALEMITDEEFDEDYDKWKAWYEKNKDK